MNNRGNLFFSGLLILTLLLTAAFTGSCDPKTAGGGGTFKIGTSIRYDTLNPLSTQLMVTGELMMLIYDPLIRLDDEQDPVPCLAKSWETTGDDLTWTYHLARDVRWHDGRPFTSADVKFTCDLIIQNGDLGIGAQYGGWLDGVTEVTCPDAYTVVIRTESPKNNILYNPMPILPKHIWQKMSPAEAMQFENAAPIGTGPYRFKSRNDQSIALSKFKDYFSSGGRVETLVFTSYVDEEAMARDLKEGKLDAATNLGAAQYQELVKTRNINTIFGSVPGFTHMGINIHAAGGKGNPALQDRRVRQALDMAVDKQKIVKTCYGGVGDPGTSLINPGDAFHYVVPDTELRGFDTAKSAALLEAAGYVDMDQDGIREDKGGNRLSFNLYCVEDNADEVRAANIIAEGCRNAGIEIRTTTMEDTALGDRIRTGDFDLFIWGWGADLDPSVILRILTTKEAGYQNETGYSSPEYDRLYDAQRKEMDMDARKELVHEMQRMIYEDAPFVILTYDENIQACRTDKWTGMKRIPPGGPFFFNFTASNYLSVTPVED